MKKEYIVFSMRLAGELMAQGFVLKRMERTTRNSNRNVFIFNESEELLSFVENYKLRKQ